MYAALARIDQSWGNAEDSRGWNCDTQEEIRGVEQVDSVDWCESESTTLTLGQVAAPHRLR